MKNKLTCSRTHTLAAIGCALLLGVCFSFADPDRLPSVPDGSVSMELVGQARVLSPQAAIQYGYLTYVAGLDSVFAGAPENESTAIFTFYNDTATTRVADNGPLRIVSREGTATFYLNESPSGNFANPDSFRAGAAVLTAHLRHQVVLDTVLNTFITEFDLTITSAEEFAVDGKKQRLGKPGEKLTWIVYGRANTATPGFSLAGYALSGSRK